MHPTVMAVFVEYLESPSSGYPLLNSSQYLFEFAQVICIVLGNRLHNHSLLAFNSL